MYPVISNTDVFNFVIGQSGYLQGKKIVTVFGIIVCPTLNMDPGDLRGDLFWELRVIEI